jgi:hypothetical protein
MGVPINNVTRRVVYAASGTGPYNFTFEILAAGDIAVYRDDTLLTLTTDYTVTINTNGTGFVTLTATPTGATQIAIVGNRTISRTTDFVTGGDFFANTLNDELDQQTIFNQQNAEGLGRALQAPQTDPTSINMTLPRSTLRANKMLSFDASGNPSVQGFITDPSSNVAITGGTINGTSIGATTRSTGAFTTLSATGVTTVQAGTAAAPAITTSGDTNTGIFFPAADTIAFTEGGTESMRLTSSGQLILNTTGTAYATGGVTAQYQIGGTTQSASSMSLITSSATTTTDPTIFLAKNKSGTQGTFTTAVVNTDELGAIRFAGSNTSTLSSGAEIKGVATATWSTTSQPTDLVFSTVQGGTTTLREVMRVTNAGEVLVGADTSGVTEVFGAGVTTMGSSGGFFNLYRNDASVVAGNPLGFIDFYSNGSGSILYAATIGAEATGTFTASSTPTALTFDTCASGATVPEERMRIDSEGRVDMRSDMTPTGNGTASSISGTTLTVGGTVTGTFAVGDRVYGEGVEQNTFITALGTGTGGAGTYTVSNTQTVSSTSIAAIGGGINVFRFTDTDSSASAGQAMGRIEWYGSDSNTPGVGVKAYIAGISETSTPDTALIFGTSDNVVDTQAVERMRIDSSGNVGIGTAEPGALLDVAASNTGLTSITANNTLRFTDTDTSTASNQPIGVIEFYSSDTTAGGTGVSAYILSAAAGTSGGGNLVFGTAPSAGSGSPVERMRIQSGGLIVLDSSAGLSISATGVTSPAAGDGNVFSGTYTPAQVGTNTNVAAVTFSQCHYMRVGAVVTVSGQLAITATTAATDTVVKMTVPVTTLFGASRQLAGAGVAITTPYAQNSLAFLADTANESVDVRLRPTVNTALTYNFSFTYLVS